MVIRGRNYHSADMTYRPMRKSGDELSNATLTFSNVSRDLIAVIRQGFERPTVEVELIAAERPDHVEETSGEVEVNSVTYDLHSIAEEVDAPNVFVEAIPDVQYLGASITGEFFAVHEVDA